MQCAKIDWSTVLKYQSVTYWAIKRGNWSRHKTCREPCFFLSQMNMNENVDPYLHFEINLLFFDTMEPKPFLSWITDLILFDVLDRINLREGWMLVHNGKLKKIFWSTRNARIDFIRVLAPLFQTCWCDRRCNGWVRILIHGGQQ